MSPWISILLGCRGMFRNPVNAFGKHNAKTEAGRIRQLLGEVQQLGIRGFGELHIQPNRELLDVAKELNLAIIHTEGYCAISCAGSGAKWYGGLARGSKENETT